MKFYSLIPAAILSVALLPAMAHADLLSDATKLGANSGAMTYCSSNYASGNSERERYNRLAVLSLGELNKLSGGNKLKAIAVKNATAEKGTYLGKPLSKSRCASLRKTMSLIYLGN